MTIDAIIGANIRAYREAVSMTQGELGSKLGEPVVSQQISQFELGNCSISSTRLVQVARILRCSVTDLFYGIEPMARQMERVAPLPKDVRERLCGLMQAMAIELGMSLKTVGGRNE